MNTSDSLALVGMGASNVSVFAHLVEQVRDIEARVAVKGTTPPPKTIYLIDREGNHGTGKAWGIHAHPSMLFSHPSGNIPDGFSNWLRANESKWREAVEAHRDGALKTWFEVNQTRLDNREYGAIAMPRFVYGMFKKAQFQEALTDLPSSLTVRILDGNIVGLNETGEGKPVLQFDGEIKELPLIQGQTGKATIGTPAQNMGSSELPVDTVVISTGFSDPPIYQAVSNHPAFFGNTLTRHPIARGNSFGEQLRNAILDRFAETGRPVKLGVLGTSATLKDITNMIDNDPEFRQAIQITAISSSGRIPEKISGLETLEESRRAIDNLGNDGKITFAQGRITDVIPADNGRIEVILDEGKATKFDFVVQALGSAGAGNMPFITMGKANGLLRDDSSSPSTVAIDPNFKAGEGVYIFGVLAEKELGRAVAGRLTPEELEHLPVDHQGNKITSFGFLINASMQAPAMAGTLTERLYGNAFPVSRDLSAPITATEILDRIAAKPPKTRIAPGTAVAGSTPPTPPPTAALVVRTAPDFPSRP